MRLAKLYSTLLLLATLFTFHVASAGDDEIKQIVESVKYSEDSKFGLDSSETVMQYSLYREFYKQKNYTDAIKHWRYVFFNAPNFKETTHQNGAVLFQKIIKETDKEEKNPFIDTLLAIYDVRLRFYGEKGDVIGRKAYDLYRFRNAETEKVLALFEKSMEVSKEKYLSSFFSPHLKTLVKANKKDIASSDDVLELYSKLGDLADKNIAANIKAEKYKVAMNDIEDYLFKNDYFQCDKLLPIVEKKYNENPEDEGNLKKLYKQLKSAKCTSYPVFINVATALNAKAPTPSVSRFLAQKKMEQSDYMGAKELYTQAAELEDDPNQKAEDFLNMAKLYRKAGEFSDARKYANDALGMKPNWGDPYILIGKLYASSGKLCGSGTGWDSQVVTWAAIDKFQKAKSVDPTVAEEAQKLINQYWKYMPSKSDVFMRSLQNGQSFSVGCWIGESTTIRTSD